MTTTPLDYAGRRFAPKPKIDPRWVRLQVGTDMVFDRRDEKDRGPTPGLVTRQFDDFVRYAEGSPATH